MYFIHLIPHIIFQDESDIPQNIDFIPISEIASGDFAVSNRLHRTMINAEINAFPFCSLMFWSWIAAVPEYCLPKIVTFMSDLMRSYDHEVVFKFMHDMYEIATSLLIRGNFIMKNKTNVVLYDVSIHKNT